MIRRSGMGFIVIIWLLMVIIAIVGTVFLRNIPESYYGTMQDIKLRGYK